MGTFYLIIALIVDPIKFVYNLYTHKEVNVFSTQASLALTMDSFNKFEEVCEEIMSEQKAFQEGQGEDIKYDFIQFNSRM